MGIAGAGAGDGIGAGTGAAAGAATGASTGTAAARASSSWDAPQFRQNFAFGATGFPHSGQKVIVISNEWLNAVH